MYSVRKTTHWHGNTQLHMMVVNLVITGLLVWQLGRDYLVIFCASAGLHLVLEAGLAATGIRKGAVSVYGWQLPRWADSTVRAIVEGPGFCVPAFFVADQLAAGRVGLAVLGPAVLIGLASLYMGLADRRDLKRLGPDESPIMSRRAMSRPGALMLLALINSIGLAVLFSLPDPFRAHALSYVAAYALMVMWFYLINYNLGVRFVQLHDAKDDSWKTPGPAFQAAALTYDSAYEMALLISPAYWITFHLGLFQYTALS